jgi:hypothetical protein
MGNFVGTIEQVQIEAGVMMAAGWLLAISAAFGWYTATRMLLEATFGWPVLPLDECAPVGESSPRGAAGGQPGPVLDRAPTARRAG